MKKKNLKNKKQNVLKTVEDGGRGGRQRVIKWEKEWIFQTFWKNVRFTGKSQRH